MNEKTPRVSVIMGVYNGDRYVKRAIDSILNQTFTDFEFIVIDDASNDETASILASYDDARLCLFTNKQNLGLARTLNRGIGIARGQYIARQDADDASYSERLFRQTEYLDKHPATGVVGTATQWIDGEGNPTEVWPTGGDNAELQQLLMHTCPLIHGSTMYRRQCFEEVGGYDATMRTGQDYDFWLRISETWDLACLPEILYQYRRHRGMASVTNKEEQNRYAEIGRARALKRRMGHLKLAWGLGRYGVSPRLRAMSRRQFAQRYVWWSAGARQCSKRASLAFLIAAFLFDPGHPSLWNYLKGIVERKSRRLAKAEATLNLGET